MPGGRESAGRRPRENNARRAKRNVSKNGPGRRPKKEQRPEGKKSAGRMALKNILS